MQASFCTHLLHYCIALIFYNKSMKSEKENEMGVAIGVDNVVIEKVRSGEITHILIDIDEDNQNMFLENIDGHLVLVTEELPHTFHGCYFYNDGEFPYAIKSVLEFLVLSNDDDYCLARIIGVDTEPITRFNYQGKGKPIVEHPDGDSCVWEVSFEVVPIPKEPRTYLMRWNPAISSFKEKDFEECMKNRVHGMFRLNWSIYEWQEARRGDCFYMMRTGDDKAGIVFSGQFLSDPYPADDWAGSNKRRMYVDMVCYNAESGATPHITQEKLQTAIPTINWSKGHSGELLSEEITTQLDEIL